MLAKIAKTFYRCSFAVQKTSLLGKKFSSEEIYSPEANQKFDQLYQNFIPANNPRPYLNQIKSKTASRLFTSCLFSKIIGNNFPLSVYVNQKIKIIKDIELNEKVIGEVEVVNYLGKNKYEIETTCKNMQGDLLIYGIAVILQE